MQLIYSSSWKPISEVGEPTNAAGTKQYYVLVNQQEDTFWTRLSEANIRL